MFPEERTKVAKNEKQKVSINYDYMLNWIVFVKFTHQIFQNEKK
jgi:hypothetical protein